MFTGLVAATHTPFHDDGTLNLAVVERQAEHLLANGVRIAFIGGTTGESHSLTVNERLQLAQQWSEVVQGSELQFVVHVGANCLDDARALASQSGRLRTAAIAMLSPSYFKPNSVDTLIDCCEAVASAAPETPFYFYDIPTMTHVQLSMLDFLRRAAERLPTLAGLKFTNIDLVSFQQCRAEFAGRYDILWGCDEMLLAALACGATGAVGSTYNFAAGIYHELIAAFERGDLNAARLAQLRSIELVQVLAARGYMAAAKALMDRQGVPVGPPRLPNSRLSVDARAALVADLARIGF